MRMRTRLHVYKQTICFSLLYNRADMLLFAVLILNLVYIVASLDNGLGKTPQMGSCVHPRANVIRSYVF